MATYNEIRKAITVHTLLGGGESPVFSDGDGNKTASMAVADFKAGRDIVVKAANGITITFPYRSIQHLEVIEASGETAKDPYGCSIIVSFVTSDAERPTFPPVEADADGKVTLPGGSEESKPIFYKDAEMATQGGVGGDVITVTENTTLYYTYQEQG